MNSQSITPKINLHGLINKYEQFNLNYSTINIFSQKYFVNTIHVNSETLGLLFMANHPTSVPLGEPEFHSHFQPYTHQSIIYSINHTTSSPNSPWTITDCPYGFHNFFTLRSQVLGPIKRLFKASTQPNHQQNT